MPFVVPHDVEELVASQVASGRYTSGDDVLRSAMRALAEMDDDLSAVNDALTEWRGGDEGVSLEDAFSQIRASSKRSRAE